MSYPFRQCKICGALVLAHTDNMRAELEGHHPAGASNLNALEVEKQFAYPDRETLLDKIMDTYRESDAETLLGEIEWLIDCIPEDDWTAMFVDRLLGDEAAVVYFASEKAEEE